MLTDTIGDKIVETVNTKNLHKTSNIIAATIGGRHTTSKTDGVAANNGEGHPLLQPGGRQCAEPGHAQSYVRCCVSAVHTPP